MKINLPVTGIEHDYDHSMQIVSTTDQKGITTSINDHFLSIAGFEEDELIGKNHNVVRHPDMPPVAFADLWQTIKTGKPWMGIVKNRCKSGDHYWVDAYVTPIFKNGQMTGYQSVRVKPQRDDRERAEKLYAQVNAKKQPLQKLPQLGITSGLLAGFGGLAIVTGLAFSWFTSAAPSAIVGIAAVNFALAMLLIYWRTSGLRQAVRLAETVVNNPIMQHVYTGRADEAGKLMLAIRMQQASMRTILGRVQNSAKELSETSSQTASSVCESISSIGHRQEAIIQVATAMEEMSASSAEVAHLAEQTAQASREARTSVHEGKNIIDRTVTSNHSLSKNIRQTADSVEELDTQCKEIGVFLDVIKDIAGQTNLLALNAAIEAARAGEMGRGFAVVADQVRTLAQRTHSSTEEIERMTVDLQSRASHAVEDMNQASSLSQETIENLANSGSHLETIVDVINTIDTMNEQVSCAAEEQSNVAQTISSQINDISKEAEQDQRHASIIESASERQTDMIRDFEGMSRQFTS